jgi:hypothetical protein
LALTLSLALGAPLALSLSCGTGGVVGGNCRPGLTECAGRCVNVGSDPDHCGACDNACGAGEQCLVGVCIQRPIVIDNLDGGVLLPDGAILLPDGATVRPDGAPLGNGGSGGGGGDGCFPPYNTADRCGDCSTSCDSALPLCAPAGPSFECSNACEEGLLACSNRCIDPLTDPDHCGSCDRRCPTAICREGACVGGTAGHVVAMCMNFETFRLNAPQNTLLGNAVFQASSDPVRVLGYIEHATARGIIGVERGLAQADDRNGRDIELWRAREA